MSNGGMNYASSGSGACPETPTLAARSKRIYIQIPAYRDRELLRTLQDVTRTAANTDRLRIAVAWQYGQDEAHLEGQLRSCGNVELIKIPANRSQGCNWARSILQDGWNGEEYTLLLDSHHRFIPGWDEQTINILEELRNYGIAKPILSGYLPPYDPHNDPQGRTAMLLRIHLCERHHDMLFPKIYLRKNFYSAVDLENVDAERYPKFLEASIADVTVEPGDILFLPVGCWHWAKSLDVSISATFCSFHVENGNTTIKRVHSTRP